MGRGATTAAALLAASAVAAAAGPAAPETGADGAVTRTLYAMGTLLRGQAHAPSRERAASALERAFRAVEREEELLSTWEEETELARLNAAATGRPVRLSPRLWTVLEEVRRWSRATGGAFDPAVGSLVDAWDLRGEGRRPDDGALESALRSSGLECFSFRPERRSAVRGCAGAWIDAGAFGKGAALERARAELRDGGTEGAAGSALLDFGGQVMALGAPPGESGWRVGVAHPDRRDEPAAELVLRGTSAATTSGSERFVSPEGRRLSHVLDPREGRPVPVGGSVTVVHESPLAADALSTALFVLGPEAGMDWARGKEEVAVLFLAEGADGRLVARWNAAMEPHLADVPAPGGEARSTNSARGPE